MSRNRADRKSIATAAGTVEYRDIGTGDAVVFVHGALLNGALWDDVVFYLPPSLRFIRLDLPLGGHRVPAARDADLSPPALARLLLDFLHLLDLEDVTLVASDDGVAICRLAACDDGAQSRRIGRLLLTNGDAFGDSAAGFAFDDLAVQLSTVDGRRRFFSKLTFAPPPDEQIGELLGGFIDDPAIRRDALRAHHATSISVRPAGRFAGAVAIVWGHDDLLLPAGAADRLSRVFPGAALRELDEARRLVPLDQPELVAEAIIDLLAVAPIAATRRRKQ